MAGLRRLARPRAPSEDLAGRAADTPFAPAAPMARPRIGRRPSKPAPRRAPISMLLWRNLALASAVVIVGGGTLAAVHLLRMRETAPTLPPAAAPVATNPAPAAAPAPQAAAAPAPPVAAIPPAAPAPSGPTEADFARPAFLEPLPPQQPAAETPQADALLSPSATGTGQHLEPAAPQGAVEEPASGEPEAAQAPARAADPAPRPKARPNAADTADEGKDGAAAQRDGQDDSNDGAASAGSGKERTARIIMDINLRTGPRRSSRTIATVAAGTTVTLVDCSKSWCEVVAKGKHGYVYRRAVKR